MKTPKDILCNFKCHLKGIYFYLKGLALLEGILIYISPFTPELIMVRTGGVVAILLKALSRYDILDNLCNFLSYSLL